MVKCPTDPRLRDSGLTGLRLYGLCVPCADRQLFVLTLKHHKRVEGRRGRRKGLHGLVLGQALDKLKRCKLSLPVLVIICAHLQRCAPWHARPV